ncbi:MAG: phosphoribosyltransferase [Bacteroidaceae bacterium]|nr:phosphoribosyltransferase [Bacteroidaceae bacterium]
MTNPTKNLIVNIITAWIVWMLTIATAYGTYCLYNASGMNWGALIGIIVTSLLLLLATGSIGVVFESYKSDKRSKQAEEKLEYLEKHCLNALKYKGIKKYIYNYISSLSTDEEKIILSMKDEEWCNLEEQLREKEIEKKEREKNLSFLSSMSKKYPHAFYKICNKRLFDVQLPREYGLILPGERNMHKIKKINDVENEDPQYARLRALKGVDDEFIRNTKMMDILSEASKYDWRKTVALSDLTDRHIKSLLSKSDDDSLRKEESQILAELKEEEIKIAFYIHIVGVKERDKYCDSFLIQNNIHDNIYEYLINHIKELDDYIHSQRNMSIEDSRKIQIQKNLSTWVKLDGKPYYFFYYYYPQRHTDITKENENIRNLIYRFKDGKVDAIKTVANYTVQKLTKTFGIYKLHELTFVCMPEASGQIDPVPWEEEFPYIVCESTDMQNGGKNIDVVKKKTPKHLGGNESAEYAVKEDFFQGKDVVLFDDIVTTGKTIHQSIEFLESNGANVLCIMSLANTYDGDTLKPHPWTNTI